MSIAVINIQGPFARICVYHDWENSARQSIESIEYTAPIMHYTRRLIMLENVTKDRQNKQLSINEETPEGNATAKKK